MSNESSKIKGRVCVTEGDKEIPTVKRSSEIGKCVSRKTNVRHGSQYCSVLH